MEKVMRMVVLGALAVTTLLQVTTAETEHVVGDSIGWTVPSNGASAYTTWASAKTFNVGDTLVFKFATDSHNVQEVNKASFDECSTKFTIGKTITTGPANITLKSVGEKYYICTVGKHCTAGQKLSITVTGTGASAPKSSSTSPASAPAPAPAASAPKSNSTSPASAPGPAAPAPKSETSTETPQAPAPASPPSSSTVVLASFLLSLSSIAFAIFL